jgi:hypothetical protein
LASYSSASSIIVSASLIDGRCGGTQTRYLAHVSLILRGLFEDLHRFAAKRAIVPVLISIPSAAINSQQEVRMQ